MKIERADFDVTHGARGGWRIKARAFSAILPMTGPEADAWVDAGRPERPHFVSARVEAFIAEVIGSQRASQPCVTAKTPAHALRAPLDGEERVTVFPLEKRAIRHGEPGEVVAGYVRCDSPRCDGWMRVAVQLPRSSYDKGSAWEGERVEGVSPQQVRDEHAAWHEQTFGISPRVQLDRWIRRHAALQWPELDETQLAENAAALLAAKAERKAKR